jgi:endonuclease YncB( thermonuclease family)
VPQAKEVTLQADSKYGRTLADVLLPDGAHFNHHSLVKDGWCWSYRRYVPGGYRTGRAREGRAGETERVMGRSAGGTAVEVAEDDSAVASRV